jgi:hypothetical protein
MTRYSQSWETKIDFDRLADSLRRSRDISVFSSFFLFLPSSIFLAPELATNSFFSAVLPSIRPDVTTAVGEKSEELDKEKTWQRLVGPCRARPSRPELFPRQQ